jgi:hypothetical protein
MAGHDHVAEAHGVLSERSESKDLLLPPTREGCLAEAMRGRCPAGALRRRTSSSTSGPNSSATGRPDRSNRATPGGCGGRRCSRESQPSLRSRTSAAGVPEVGGPGNREVPVLPNRMALGRIRRCPVEARSNGVVLHRVQRLHGHALCGRVPRDDLREREAPCFDVHRDDFRGVRRQDDRPVERGLQSGALPMHGHPEERSRRS